MEITEAGPTLDKLMAEEILGQVPCMEWHIDGGGKALTEWLCKHERGTCYPMDRPRKYSSFIGWAFDVADHYDDIEIVKRNKDWWVKIDGWAKGYSPSLPLAICIAAKKRVSK